MFPRAIAISILGAALSVVCEPVVAQTKLQPIPASDSAKETAGWKTYEDGSFKYPPGWEVWPQLYSTPPQEEAGEPESEVGLYISPKGEGSSDGGAIGMGGRQTGCEDFGPPCKCFTIYWAVYTCATDPETLRVYDLLLTTIRRNDPNAPFQVLFPAAQDRLRPGKHYTLRWRIKPDVPEHNVRIIAYNTSKLDWRNPLLDAKDVPDTGRYEWAVPAAVDSPGPYLIDISFVTRVKPSPPALGGSRNRNYEGQSDPFYIY
jgi:hypothetical protein